MARKVRVRYAPSPTGEPHVGNIRTAIFNWLFARNQGGEFIVRIEDTDNARRVDGAVDVILEALRWLGLDWDEGPEVGGPYEPYVQSQRLSLYHEAAKRLVEQGNAYYCYCSPDRLHKMRTEQQLQKRPPGYDRRCRDTFPKKQADVDQGITPVIRFKMPLNGITIFQDLIRGDVRFDFSVLDDFVILKSDGYPTYHLAVTVDDHIMQITHVMRAEEWLPSAPKHQELYRALGYEMPVFAHLPIILGEDRAKLSKRHGATSVLEYKKAGYLPEALLNFLVLLGWSLDDRTEVIAKEDLIKHFRLDRIGAPAAIFNQEKLAWLNGIYIRQLSPSDLANKLFPFLKESLPMETTKALDIERLERIVPLVQERLKTLGEAHKLTGFFFIDSLEYETASLIQKGMDREGTLWALSKALAQLEATPDWQEAVLEKALRDLAEHLEVRPGQLFGTIRLAVTGQTATPPLFSTLEVIGREQCLARIEKALARLKKGKS